MTPRHVRSTLAMAALAASAAFIPATAGAAEDDGLDWMVVTYLWGADLTIDARDESVGVDFSDLVSSMEVGFLGHLEAQGDNFGGFADVVFLAVGATENRPLFAIDVDNDTLLLDAALVWSPGEKRLTGFELFGGLRYISNDFEIVADPVLPGEDIVGGNDGSYADALLGARYIFPVSDHWRVTLRGDVSGGDTEGSFSVSAHAGYTTGRHTFLAGWRHLEIDLLSGNEEDLTVEMSGPMIAYGFSF